VATWRGPKAGTVHARLEVDATPLLAYADRLTAAAGVPVRLVHVLGRAVALGLREVPAFNARVLFGRVVPHERVDVGFAVDIGDGDDLAPVLVRDADLLPTVRIAALLDAAARAVRTGENRAFAASTRLVRLAPWWSVRPVLAVAGLWNGGLGRPGFGQPGSPLGHVFVSNVGSLGLDEVYLAPLPFARVPLYLAVGAVRDRPFVVDGALTVRPTVLLTATADHRVVDGAHAGALAAWLRTVLADPQVLDAAEPRPPGGRA
jgi:pyruvate dehydrogenase E2 component (dihydrolipoamide acetyltransferase)